MQYYPRFIKKELVDEYLHSLAPDRELFTDFKALDRKWKDHNRAFREVRYEDRFDLTLKGRQDLERLSWLAKDRDVVLFCQCASLEYCHADLLLLIARHEYGATIRSPRMTYPLFEKRLSLGF
jgi:uncharacterized protein YeaO (DUF488 family)